MDIAERKVKIIKGGGKKNRKPDKPPQTRTQHQIWRDLTRQVAEAKKRMANENGNMG